VKVFFGNYGSKDTLLANLRVFAAEATAAQELWTVVASEYDRDTEEFPERVHVNELVFRWLWEQADVNARWAQWAIDQVEGWPDTSKPRDVEAALDVFRSVLGHTTETRP
jgi:hypothetical protein